MTQSPFDRLVRSAASLALVFTTTAPAIAQWKTNPIVEQEDLQYLSPTEDRCRLELDGCAFDVSALGGPYLHIERTDIKGFAAAPAYITDPLYPPLNNVKNNQLFGCAVCKTGNREFMAAYNAAAPLATSGIIRVTKVYWDPSNDGFVVQPGFPVTISNTSGQRLAIAANENGTSIDGAMVCWLSTGGAPGVYQQGVNASGALIWPTLATYPSGVLLEAGLGTASNEPPSIVSTGDGMAVATYHRLASGQLQHRTVKLALGSGTVFGPMTVPGQGPSSTSRCAVASDGSRGAFYGFATEIGGTTTTLVAARVTSSGATSSLAFWDSNSNGGPSGVQAKLRALNFLALPSGNALLTYRDMTGIRCIDFSASSTTLLMSWTRFVRGASLANNDDAAGVLSADTACLVTTSDSDVRAKAIKTDSTELWDTAINDPVASPAKQFTATQPQWPHVFAVHGYTPGFMVAWYDYATDKIGNWLAERVTPSGKLGRALFMGPGSIFLPDSALLMDVLCPYSLQLADCQFALGDGTGHNGVIEFYAAIGGSYVGNENNVSAWTLLGSAPVVSAGPGQLSDVNLPVPIVLPPGSNGLMLRGVGVSLGTVAQPGNGTLGLGDLTVQYGAQVANWPNGALQAARLPACSLGIAAAVGPASHVTYGAGCGASFASPYQLFPTAGAASAALSNTSINMTFVGTTYQFSAGGPAFVPQPFATPLALGDDAEVDVALPMPLPYPGGMTTTLRVCSNGFVSAAPGNGTGYLPSGAAFCAFPQAVWGCWHDFNLPEGGVISFGVAPAGDIAYVTWDNVESFPAAIANPGSMQLQFNMLTGSVVLAFGMLDAIGGSLYGDGYLIGYSPAGVSVDPGPRDFATAMPFVSGTVDSPGLALTCSQLPLIGTTMTHVVSNVPAGAVLAARILSLAAVQPGLDLGILGAPGCLQSVDLSGAVTQLGFGGPTLSFPLSIPNNPMFIGLPLCSQAAAIVPGINALGVITSNGLRSTVSSY